MKRATVIPLLLVAAVVVLLPAVALFELPMERQVKDLAGIEYKEPGCSPVRDRGRFGAWRREGRLPTPLEEARAVRIGDLAYIVGGLDGPVVDNVGPTIAAFRSYNPRSGRFTDLPSLPRRLNHVGMAAIGETIYVAGGLGDKLEFLSEATDSAWRFHLSDGRWKELPPLPTARGALGMTAVGGVVYAVGGRDGRVTTDAVEAYDPQHGSWSERAPLPDGRDHLGVASLNGFVYVVGGRRDGGEERPELLRYDPAADRWTQLAPLPAGTSGANLEAVAGELVVTGGEDSEQAWVTGRTFAFSPRTGRWRALPSSPRPKHGYASAPFGDRLYVFGGSVCAGSTPSATIESLQVRGRGE